jgi:hypothetical protein
LNNKSIYILGAIVFMATMASVSWPIGTATATADPKNEWGDLASDLGEERKMGSHSSDPVQGNDDRETPRTGVGNLDLDEGDGDIDDDGGDRDHPSETADILRDLCESGQGSEDQCP